MTNSIQSADDADRVPATPSTTIVTTAASPTYDGVAFTPPAADISFATVLRIMLEWRWLVLGVIGAALAFAVLATLLTTPVYRAQAVLEVNPPSVDVSNDAKSDRQSSFQDNDFLSTQYGLLRSRSLAERVSEELNLAGNSEFAGADGSRADRVRSATNRLMNNFKVIPVPESRLVRISYDNPNPGLAARVANNFADSFITTNLERRYEASSYARNFLERQLVKVKGELERSERQLVAYAQAQGIINTGSSEPGKGGGDASSLQGASLVALNEALTEAQTKRIAAEQAYRQSNGVGATAEATTSSQVLRQQRAALESEYREKLQRMKPDYPDMLALRSRIDELSRQISSENSIVRSGRSNTLLAEYRAAAAAESALRGQVSQLKGSVLNLRGRSIQYTILQREVDTNRALYDALLQRYKEIGVAGGIGKNLVSIVDRAQAPTGPYKPDLLINLLIGLGLGTALGVALALALEFMNDVIKTPEDVRNKLGLTSLGAIPKKEGEGSFAEELSEQGSALAEAYFSLRTTLQFTTENGAPRSLLVTSTRAAEGKSSTTLALAQNFARLSQRVLLIDADLRRPAFVSEKDKIGLSVLLTNVESVARHVLTTSVENLWLMPCGPLPPSPAELLASPRLRSIIDEAVGLFDMVIVDGPPILGLADAPLLGAAVSRTIMVIESGKTRTRAATDAYARLRSSGSKVLGAVLTKYKHQSHAYGYGYEAYKYNTIGSREREIRLLGFETAPATE